MLRSVRWSARHEGHLGHVKPARYRARIRRLHDSAHRQRDSHRAPRRQRRREPGVAIERLVGGGGIRRTAGAQQPQRDDDSVGPTKCSARDGDARRRIVSHPRLHAVGRRDPLSVARLDHRRELMRWTPLERRHWKDVQTHSDSRRRRQPLRIGTNAEQQGDDTGEDTEGARQRGTGWAPDRAPGWVDMCRTMEISLGRPSKNASVVAYCPGMLVLKDLGAARGAGSEGR